MKNYQLAIGVAALTALCAVKGSAQINYQNGDLLAGFRNGGNTDVIVDLGPISNFEHPFIDGTSPVTFAGVSSALTSVFGGTTGLFWSVFGVNDLTTAPYNHSVSQTDANTLWLSYPRANAGVQTIAPNVYSSAVQQLPLTDIQTVGSSTSSGSGSPVTSISANIISVNNSTGFGYSPSIGSGNFNGDWHYNIEQSGAGTSDFYQFNPSASANQKASYLGNFSLDSSGVLTYSPVPEPSTWAMLGTGAMSLLALGRFRNRK